MECLTCGRCALLCSINTEVFYTFIDSGDWLIVAYVLELFFLSLIRVETLLRMRQISYTFISPNIR